MLRNILKSRYSQLWHMGKAHMFKMPYFPGGAIATSNACPLCGPPDSGSHILGGCLHPEMKKMMIFRHDEAHRMMLKGISKGKHGSSLTLQMWDEQSSSVLLGCTTNGFLIGSYQTQLLPQGTATCRRVGTR